MSDISDDDQVTGVNQALMAQLFKRASTLIRAQEDAASRIAAASERLESQAQRVEAQAQRLEAAGQFVGELLQRTAAGVDKIAGAGVQQMAARQEASSTIRDEIAPLVRQELAKANGQELSKLSQAVTALQGTQLSVVQLLLACMLGGSLAGAMVAAAVLILGK